MKLLVIVGPTSSGKTSLGVDVAKKFDGELVSADSRQVYKKLDIGTGKDLPNKVDLHFVSDKVGGYYLIDGVKVWGYDLVDPKEDYSVTQYIQDARSIIDHIDNREKLPIIVGGTGFYIKGVVDGLDTAKIPKNKELRKSLKKLSAGELFEKLAKIAPEKAGNMNISDKKNPRRLIRAIEIAQWRMNNDQEVKIKKLDADVLFVGIKVDKKELENRIKKRIDERLQNDFDKEVESLLLSGVGWEHQSMQALGYKQWQSYLKRDISKQQAIDDWFNAEKKYAKKQMMWFKKDKRINWFDQSSADWQKEVVQLVNTWVNDSNRF